MDLMRSLALRFCTLRSMATLLIWRVHRLQTRCLPTELRFVCMAPYWHCCGRISLHAQQRCGGMRVTILFSRKASARDGQRLLGFSTFIAELTAAETHYVKRLDPTTWGKFLQILEDASQFAPITLDHIGALLHGGPQRHYEGSYEPVVNGQ
jgi:hypothetical protein